MRYLLAGFTALFFALATVASAQTTTDKVKETTKDTADKVKTTTKETTDKAMTSTKDAWLASKTKIALYADERVSGNAINVDARDGMIVLRGKVTSTEEKKAAEDIARRIEGVTLVKNNLEVVPAADKKAVNRKDDEIKKAVKDRLAADARMKGSDVEVRADNGVVTLTGDARDINARARASEIARGVSGVKAVKNELKEKS
jgi:hyperosmotically inducible periplasmic protein